MIELITQCTFHVEPAMVQEIIKIESSGDVFALNVNGIANQPKPKNQDEAVYWSLHYIDKGHTVDMGLMQVNSANLSWLGLSRENIASLFTPCANVHAGTRILHEAYERAVDKHGHGQTALKAALSAYNTGDFSAGFSNGYVARYLNNITRSSDDHFNEDRQFMSEDTLVKWSPPVGQ